MTASHRLAAAALAVAVLGVWLTGLYRFSDYRLDDALIYLRYIRNAVEHGQLVYNLGDYFNGLTSPLYTGVLLLLAQIFNNLLVTANIYSALMLLAAAVALGYWIKGLDGRLAGFIAVVFILFSVYFYACFGMETAQFLLLTALALIAYSAQRFEWSVLALGLAWVTRSEAALLAAVMGLHYLHGHGLREPRRLLRLVLILLLPYLLVAAFNLYYYGAASPHTAMAKFWQGQSQLWGRWPRGFISVQYHIELFWAGQLWLFALFFALMLAGLYKTRKLAATRIVFSFLLIYGLIFTLLNVPAYLWYYAAFYFYGLAYAAIGAAALLQSPRKPLVFATTGLLLLAAGLHARQLLHWPVHGAKYDGYRDAGLWITAHTPPGSSVAAAEIGNLGWYAERPIVDIVGLVNRDNARFIAERNLEAWLAAYRPDYVLIHAPIWPMESAMAKALASGDYRELPEARHADLRLLRRLGPARR